MAHISTIGIESRSGHCPQLLNHFIALSSEILVLILCTVVNIQVEARRGGRSVMYDQSDTYVLLAPGADEVFMTEEELVTKLAEVLSQWDGPLPQDLQRDGSLEDTAKYLVGASCELELGGGKGSYQWYSVRLD